MNALRLPLRFDPVSLRGDLELIAADEWVPHYNERDYGGDWRGVALRSLSGSASELAAHAADPSAFADTPLHHRCSYLRGVLAAFQCPLKSVRLLSLAPNSVVREHCDPGFGDGEVRIHVPVQTSAAAEFYLNGERLRLEEGDCYFIDVSRPHRVINRGERDRIHLIIDANVNDWLQDLLRRGETIERLPALPSHYQEFRNLVVNDAELARALHAIPDSENFVESVVRLGRQRGFEFDAADVRPRQSSDVEDHHAETLSPSGWLPTAVRPGDSRPLVEWVYFGSRPLTEPFFEDSVRACLRHPFARFFTRATLLQPADNGTAPTGFIFHMSRCGSTLIAQMLAALERAVVVSEAPAIDDVIQEGRQDRGVSLTERAGCLRSIVSALVRPRRGEDLGLVKLDAWHIHDLPLIRAAFPETPWIFLYRDPAEVLTSQLRRPGKLCLPGAIDPAILGLESRDVALPQAEWCARALAGICRAALSLKDDPKGMFLNYRRLPEAVWGALADHFSVSFTSGDLARMRDAARFDAKDPSRPFQGHDPEDDREDARTVDDLAARLLTPLYAELERS